MRRTILSSLSLSCFALLAACTAGPEAGSLAGGGSDDACSSLAAVCRRCDAGDVAQAGLSAACLATVHVGEGRACAADLQSGTFAACAGGGAGGHGSGAGSGAGVTSTSASPSRTSTTGGGADAPRILQFNTNATTLLLPQPLVFTAIVTDPQGIGDVIGGSLQDPSGASYGAFATDSQEGAYQITLNVADLQAVRPIGVAYGGSDTRKFVAVFFDAAGHQATASTTVDIACPGGLAWCDGVCVDTTTDWENCGACGSLCNSPGAGLACTAGRCEGTLPAQVGETCNEACAHNGEVCSDRADPHCSNYVESRVDFTTQAIQCGTPYPSANNVDVTCCCYTSH